MARRPAGLCSREGNRRLFRSPFAGCPMHQFRNALSTAVVWAMLPLTLLGGMPRLGCVCANGRQKLCCDCQRSGSCGRAENGSAAGPSACCGRSAGGSAATQAAVPQPEACAGCCGHSDSTTRPGQPSQVQPPVERCCQGVVFHTALPSVAETATAPSHDWQPLLAPTLDQPRTAVVCAAVEQTRQSTLPVTDLLIAHQILRI